MIHFVKRKLKLLNCREKKFLSNLCLQIFINEKYIFNFSYFLCKKIFYFEKILFLNNFFFRKNFVRKILYFNNLNYEKKNTKKINIKKLEFYYYI